MLAAIKKQHYAPGWQVDFLRTQTQLNGLFIAVRVPKMLERKNQNIWDMVFPFLAWFMDQCHGRMQGAPLKKVHVFNSKLMRCMTTDSDCKGRMERQLLDLKYRNEMFRISLVRSFSDHCNFELYTLKFRLLDYVVKYLPAFRTKF